MFSLLVCFLVFGATSATSATGVIHRPSYLVPCSKRGNFSECAMKHAVAAIPFMLKGDRRLGLPTFTPLKISKIEVKGTNGFRVLLKDLNVYGLENVKPLNIKVDFENRRAQVLSTVPKLVVLGDYEVGGNIMIFALNGHGPVNLTFTNGIYEYGFEWKTEIRDGLEYGQITNSNFDYNLKSVKYNFDNIINNDKALSEQVNKILNLNWEIVNEDIKPSICDTLLFIHNEMFKKIFTQVPFRELFLD
ncbi:unnamed protein product [Psylliodes chrysocephalus]|uniref:Uncharacterized protein n=1 Tax=Psylliodes chrysocephalus TaxID=3402493 RepID=A0A9P0D3B0_9CUCU|nr:unnamed protein product [Psylliodes chrysocephala]